MTESRAAPPESGAADPAALIRTRQYRVLLVVAGFIGVLVSLACWGFLEAMHRLQQSIFENLPKGLGFNAPPWWWPLPPLVLAGLLVAVAVVRLPGHGGHDPVEGLAVGTPTTPAQLPSVLLAAGATLGLGLVPGPEAPLIALGGGAALLTLRLARRRMPEQAKTVIGAAAAFVPWMKADAS